MNLLAKEIIEITSSSSELEFLPLPGDDPKQRDPDITLAREKLGWEPMVDRAEGLVKTIEYFKTKI